MRFSPSPTLLLAMVSASVAAVSCQSDTSAQLAGIGTLTVTVESDDMLRLPGGEESGVLSPSSPSSECISLSVTDTQGAYSHTWDDFASFPQNESYFAGTYVISAECGHPFLEGFDIPAFSGTSEVAIAENSRTDAVITLRPASAFVSVGFSESIVEACPGIKALLHSEGGRYHIVAPDEERLLCLNPSETELYISLPSSEGAETRFLAATLGETAGATLYGVEIDADLSGPYPVILVSAPGETSSFTLDPLFLSATPPSVTLSNGGEPLTLPEGDVPSLPLTAEIVPGSVPLSHLYLSALSPGLGGHGMPGEVDLLNLSPAEEAALDSLGLGIDVTPAKGGTVDFTDFLGNIVYLTPEEALSSFSLLAVDSRGFVSEPSAIDVTTTPVEINVVETSPAVICVDRSTVVVQCPAPGFERNVDIEIESSDGGWIRAPFSVSPRGDSLYGIDIDLPEGSEPVNMRVLYCDEVRSSFVIQRVMPEYSVAVDGYAKNAAIRILAADPSLTGKITRRRSVYVDGVPVHVYRRFPDDGIVNVIGLSPSRTYKFKTTLMEGVEKPVFTPETEAVTEGTPQLPNADFEERNKGPRYTDMPSGGLYAQTSVDIFNWQHHTSFDCEVPKGWATTNEKTFNLSSSNINTWYVLPSARLMRDDAVSGSFSVMLASVGFDPDGMEIPPYSQTGKPYLDYSPVVPDIAFRAAGKLFLGEYSFDGATMKESYREGISWNSRPYSLNGSYKYLPCAAERDDGGLVKVEVIGRENGEEVTIASGRLVLPYAASFTAFSVPLEYHRFGVKAARIKVMFASSAHIGTIEEETASVATVHDAVTATATGGRLWIDNVRLAY